MGIIDDMLRLAFSTEQGTITGQDILEIEIGRQALSIQPEVNITGANAIGKESAQILATLFIEKYGFLHVHEFWHAFKLALTGKFEVDLNFYQSFNFLNVSRVMDAYVKYRQATFSEVNKWVEAEGRYNLALMAYNQLVEYDNELTRKNITEIYNFCTGQSKQYKNWTRIKNIQYVAFAPECEKEKATFIHEIDYLLEWLEKHGRYIKTPDYQKNIDYFQVIEAENIECGFAIKGFEGKLLAELVAEQLPKAYSKAKAQADEVELINLVRGYVKIGSTINECISDLFHGPEPCYPVCQMAKSNFEASPEYKTYFELVRLKAESYGITEDAKQLS